MTTVLSQKGQIVLPSVVREQLGLQPGDDFEIWVTDDGAIMLRRITSPPNHGVVDHLVACPGELNVPERSQDLPRVTDFDALGE